MNHPEPASLVLLIDSDPEQSRVMTALLRDAGYELCVTNHEDALPLLRDSERFDAVVIRATSEPSTLSPQDRLGEFVLRYTTHVAPAVLLRTIVITSLPPERRSLPETFAVLDEPLETPRLLRLIEACMRAQKR
jgi:hypothetical protein